MTKKILIADQNTDLVHAISQQCRNLGATVLRSPDAMHALLGAHRAKPDLILLEARLPAGSGLAVCEMLANDPGMSSVPVIIMSDQSSTDITRRCNALGAHFVRKDAELWNRLGPLICQLLHFDVPTEDVELPDLGIAPKRIRTHASRRTVLCIDHDEAISENLRSKLKGLDVDIRHAFNAVHGYWTSLSARPDLIVCDLSMSDSEAKPIIERFKSHSITKDIPVIVVTNKHAAALERTSQNLGVLACLGKPLDFDELVELLCRVLDLSGAPSPDTAMKSTVDVTPSNVAV